MRDSERKKKIKLNKYKTCIDNVRTTIGMKNLKKTVNRVNFNRFFHTFLNRPCSTWQGRIEG